MIFRPLFDSGSPTNRRCGHVAAQALAQRGFQHLYNLAGGMLAVREAPVARPQG